MPEAVDRGINILLQQWQTGNCFSRSGIERVGTSVVESGDGQKHSNESRNNDFECSPQARNIQDQLSSSS